MKIEKITLYTSVDWRGFAIDGIMCPAVQKVIREKGGVTILDHDDEELLETKPRGKAPDFLLERRNYCTIEQHVCEEK